MKLKDIKKKIDTYFDKVDPLEFVNSLEELGCKFEDIIDDESSIFFENSNLIGLYDIESDKSYNSNIGAEYQKNIFRETANNIDSNLAYAA